MTPLPRLRVSDNRRFLVHEDGRPFFYLADTAWELFHRLSRAETETYLRDRAAKGFTVIQAVGLAEYDGLTEPNAAGGDLPLRDNDPTRPNEPYWQHVDWVINRAASLGLYIGLLPTWGDKWNKKWGIGPEVFTPENARIYGEWIGRRYRNAPVIWILGGDRPVETDTHKAIIRAMAEGVTKGDDGAHLRTFHPTGGATSSDPFHAETWLDFNMWQSGHSRNRDNYELISRTYALSPTKPCLDAEPGYEDHPAGFKLDNGYLDDYDCRKAIWWATLAGACGHTYGCHDIWQFLSLTRKPITWARTPWSQALHLPGADHMRHARNLLLSRPYLTRIPDPSLITSEIGEGTFRVQSARAEDGSYAVAYVPAYKAVAVDLAKLSGKKLDAWWFDPRTGTAERIAGDFSPAYGAHEFTPPTGGPDWVLVIDDAARGYSTPGAVSYGK